MSGSFVMDAGLDHPNQGRLFVLHWLWLVTMVPLQADDSETGNACGYRALGQIAASQGTRVYLGIVRRPRFGRTLPSTTSPCRHFTGSRRGQDLSFASFEREAWLAFIRRGQLPDSMSWNPLDPQKPVANAIGYAGNLGEDHDAADRCNFWAAHNVSRTWYWIAR
ncbi:hypothetical protein AK812_SmicGene13930 [Symbiodinium microadriaticum]|uniref:C-type lectin domain-containing protein n=1 Tax=Symbiodinium microadriaticum TaxID=2951 RepID=A0A1Q9E6X1_SYMMI|nr:hypothetical protein AK812_SmicGene13930 [Symbiodinium microadriaticum]